ncbi:AAA family ATPase [Arthrobacter sp. JZ12]|uniref:AAA family ATPase n=1 Tax=Arthrobacter sp. JZ12 TaxID=2654190 RepID=UPI002B4AA392|nr:AAA family ATPase [Arthrobacter sp. JZ12]WRH25971.1 AAA family ATPase [Arthrobacter sp. JZ12]
MKFRVIDGFGAVSKPPHETLVLLRRNSWDDFTFKTSFEAELLRPVGDPVDLGLVKILRAGQRTGPTTFEANEFEALGSDYCSLGQDIEFYEKLTALAEEERVVFLRSIRDAATDKEIAATFEGEEGWNKSLLRFGQAEHTLASASSLFDGTEPSEGIMFFTHRSRELDAEIRFDFDDSDVLPGRCKVLIGYNGVGKTRLLADLARATSKVGQSPENHGGSESLFSAVLAVSYSAFDTFELPPSAGHTFNGGGDADHQPVTTYFGYTYCGLRRLENGQASSQLKSIHELTIELSDAFRLACSRDASALNQALRDLELDPSFGRSGLSLSKWVTVGELPDEELGMLSAGQKIVINIIVQLGAHLRNRSLVLIDEPETHLHPSLLAALLRGTQKLLDGFDSFAIIATHSPVVLQEVPAKDVQVIERFGSTIRAVDPQLETFGAGLGELTHEAFGLDNSVSDYRTVIRELAQKLSHDELEQLFPLGLSSQARALALRARGASRTR